MCLKIYGQSSVNRRSHEFSMGKKRSWFSLVKRLFVSEPKSKAEKKSKRWRWVFGGLKPKQYPILAPPHRIINEAREEQRKHAMAVAIAMAAAAEAAVAAARAAAEVVQLTGVPQSYQEYEKRTRNLAATKIQAAYRAHLARKALKALKGLVKLQAMVRGRIVRRRIITKLKCFPPIAKTQSQAHEVRFPTVDESWKDGKKKQFLSLKEELEERKTRLKCNSRKNWDYSLFSREDMEALWLRKQEAAAKRERMKKYSFSHRERRNDQNMETLVPNKENGRWSNQLEQRVESQACKRRGELLNLKSTVCSNFIASGIKLRNASKQDSSAEELNSPTYMAGTESAKAKARSVSTPKQRLGLFDNCADSNSPYKLRLSSWSSFNGEFASANGRRGASEQISRSMNGLYQD